MSAGAERYRLAAWASAANLASRGLSLVLMLAGVRLSIGYLGPERFGVWATFSSLVTMLTFLDLGVGNALVNRVAAAAANEDRDALPRTISCGLALLALLGLAAAALLGTLAQLIPWGPLFKLGTPAAALEAGQAALCLALLFGPNLLASGLLRVLAGRQRAWQAHLIWSVATLVAIVTLWLATRGEAGVRALILSTFGVQTGVTLVVATVLLWANGLLQPFKFAGAFADEARAALATGSLFLALQVATMVGWGADLFILSSTRGAAAAAVLSVAQRLFQFVSQPLAIGNSPLWPAYADAHARGDKAFIRRTLKLSLGGSLAAAAVIAPLLACAGPWLIGVWTGEALAVPRALLAIMATWAVLEAGGNALAMYMNGCGIVREQVVLAVSFCLVALPLKFIGATAWGAPGLVLATLVAYLATTAIPYVTVYRARLMRPAW